MASEKQTIALVSIGASAVLAVTKLVAAVLTGSLAILSEAVHSILDLGATIITYFAVRYSDQPPDEEHHYGHAKIESVAALIETGLLFLTTAWVSYEAIHRLIFKDAPVDVTWWAIAIIAGSILIDYNRARSLKTAAEKHGSEALEADALHFSSDMWSSLVVLVGLGGVWFGIPWADSAAALGVSVFVALAGWRLGQRTLATLLDTAPEGAAALIRKLAETTPGVIALRRARIRPAGSALFVDVDIDVSRTLPLETVAAIKAEFEHVIRAQFPSADISVTAHPVALDDETVFDKVLLLARNRNLAIHHLTVQHIDGRTAVSFDLEVDGRMPLGTAHDIATELEQALKNELGTDVEIDSHIEPIHPTGLEGSDVPENVRTNLHQLLVKLAAAVPLLSDIHNVRVRQNEHGLFVSYHCRFDPAQPVETVHENVDQLETALRGALTEIRRVIAHAEPIGHAPH